MQIAHFRIRKAQNKLQMSYHKKVWKLTTKFDKKEKRLKFSFRFEIIFSSAR